MMNKQFREVLVISLGLYGAAMLCLPLQATLGPAYLYWILLAGPMVIVPWGLVLLTAEWPTAQLLVGRLLPFGGLLLALAYSRSPGYLAVGLAVGWLIITLWLLGWMWRRRSRLPLGALAAAVFLNVAAAWAVADRLGWQPLGFDPLIVLLTAIHFHYAGFALAVMTALLPSSAVRKRLSWGLLIGVGGVAIGITSTQLAGPPWVEILSVTVMVAIGWGVAMAQAKEALRLSRISRIVLLLGSICLTVGLALALLYGWRFEHQWSWLTLPWMYATHGVLNSVGFAFLSLWGRLSRLG